MTNWIPLFVTLAAFGCVGGIIFVVGRYLNSQVLINRRLSTHGSGEIREGTPRDVSSGILSRLTSRINEKSFGIEGAARSTLRQKLIRAGYFSDAAIRTYILFRLGAVLVIPTITFLVIRGISSNVNSLVLLGCVVLASLLAIIGPDAYVSRRSRMLQWQNRVTFPDLIDMLVVCVDAGLSLDAALNRIWPEIAKKNRAFGTNLAIVGVETRAGRSLSDALSAFAERLDLDEARSFTILLKQSLELGTDVGDALRTFSDEMRKKRLLRAEEMANKLPVKIVLPLGMFIFPVILMVVMVPLVIQMAQIFQRVMSHH